jgi:uncharacterized protein (TIGR00730 family)
VSERRGSSVPPELSDVVDELARVLYERVEVPCDRDQIEALLASVVALAREPTGRLDLKIANAALAEMTEAFRVFRPYRDVAKVTIFGSARTRPEDPLYGQARELARRLATEGWMVVTGAGPGIMAAGLEGAGRENAFGINIRLPFEQGANPFIAGDPKLVDMKYFFTRKLMLMKESDGFCVLPGGFGTQDEAFELLTLVQTGKAEPAPIVLLDTPEGHYWERWEAFVSEELAGRGLVSPDDRALYRVTDDVDAATAEILGFYRNYHSRRYVGNLLVIRLRYLPNGNELATLSREFADICDGIRPSGPLPPERADHDHLELARVVLRFDRVHHGRLRQLIDALNRIGPGDGSGGPPRHRRAARRPADRSLTKETPLAKETPLGEEI